MKDDWIFNSENQCDIYFLLPNLFKSMTYRERGALGNLPPNKICLIYHLHYPHLDGCTPIISNYWFDVESIIS